MSGLTGSNSINQSGIVGGDSCIGSIATTTTGLISGGSLDIDNVLINGTTIGHTCDTDLLTVGNATLLAKGTVTVGVDGTGHDVTFYGDSPGAFMLYDQSADMLEIRGATAAGPGYLKLSTGEATVVACDVLGKIEFQAPAECGADAVRISAKIEAVAQVAFDATNNATDLVFYTGHSEDAAEKFRFTSQNEIGIAGANYGTDGQVLTSGGAGAAAAWEDAGGGAVSAVANGANDRIATFSSSTALNGEATLTYDGEHLTISDGNLIIGTAGHGIDFSAQACPAAGSPAEVLNHYEEGEWTPSLMDGSHGAGENQTYNASTKGHYTRVGNHVHAQFRIQMTDLGCLSGGATFVGSFPFVNKATAGNCSGGSISYYEGLSASVEGSRSLHINQSWNFGEIYANTSTTTVAQMAISQFNDNTILVGTFDYDVT